MLELKHHLLCPLCPGTAVVPAKGAAVSTAGAAPHGWTLNSGSSSVILRGNFLQVLGAAVSPCTLLALLLLLMCHLTQVWAESCSPERCQNVADESPGSSSWHYQLKSHLSSVCALKSSQLILFFITLSAGRPGTPLKIYLSSASEVLSGLAMFHRLCCSQWLLCLPQDPLLCSHLCKNPRQWIKRSFQTIFPCFHLILAGLAAPSKDSGGFFLLCG